jgi:hypothetical protein
MNRPPGCRGAGVVDGKALIEELGIGAQARLDPAEGRCCVTITLP